MSTRAERLAERIGTVIADHLDAGANNGTAGAVGVFVAMSLAAARPDAITLFLGSFIAQGGEQLPRELLDWIADDVTA